MSAARLRLFLPPLLVGLTLTPALTPALGCDFCREGLGPTMVANFAQADMVLLGIFTNPRLGAGGFEEGTTDFLIEKVLKSHTILQNKGKITLAKYITATKSKFLIFCDQYKKSIDPYRAFECSRDTVMVKYLTGALALKDKSPADRLRYCFDFLQCPEFEISLDAYREFGKASYKDYKEMARKLDPQVLIDWLSDPKTPPYRYGLYASLLGHCGKAEHGKFLREMIDDPEKGKGSGIDGMLASYVMLQPKEAWAYLTGVLKTSKDFGQRYAILRTCRFLYNERPDLIEQKDLAGGVAHILEHQDMADFAIEDLRRWKRWEMADRVLDLFGRESHDIGPVKRAILRFALRAQEKVPRAKRFVAEQIRRDKEYVAETEEILQLEDPAPPPSIKSSSSSSSSGGGFFLGLVALGLTTILVPGHTLLPWQR